MSDWTHEGIVETHRAKILLLRPDALRPRSCECYELAQRFYDEETRLWQQFTWRDRAHTNVFDGKSLAERDVTLQQARARAREARE